MNYEGSCSILIVATKMTSNATLSLSSLEYVSNSKMNANQLTGYIFLCFYYFISLLLSKAARGYNSCTTASLLSVNKQQLEGE